MILAGDIGGTKTNLALFKVVNNQLTIEVQERLKRLFKHLKKKQAWVKLYRRVLGLQDLL